MLDLLKKAETAVRPFLDDIDAWNSLLIDDEFPLVERLYRPWEGGRINLHRIHPCAAGLPLVHPHPWPSAMLILRGEYETAYGTGPGPEPPEMGPVEVCREGYRYAMTNPFSWHYVRPFGRMPVITLMVTGAPWAKEACAEAAPRPWDKRPAVSATAKGEILEAVRNSLPRNGA